MFQPQQDYQYSLQEVHDLLLRRDTEDAVIDRNNRENLIQKGLSTIEPKRYLKIDTGVIVGIDNVVEHIQGQLLEEDKIISLQGLSGVGKSSTAKALKNSLGAVSFSFGEIFRYLTYQHYVHNISNFKEIIQPVEYRFYDKNLCLFCGDNNITHNLATHLMVPDLVSRVPSVAAQTQDIVINFVKKEIDKIGNQTECILIIEGRNFTLDFLPCDLRIELYADSMIRAKRRFHQDID